MKKFYYSIFFIIILSIGIVVGLHAMGYLVNNQRIIPTEKLKDVSGIESIKYEVFVSNDSIQQSIDYYTDIFERNSYSSQDSYSRQTFYNNVTIYYRSFTKGLNGIVIFLSIYHEQTWICFTTSDIFHYQQMFDYLVDQHIIA